MSNSAFDITRINPFATVLTVTLLAFMFGVSGYDSSVALNTYSPFQIWIDHLVTQNRLLGTIFNGGLVVISAILLGRLGVQHSIYPRRCYLAAIFFVVLSMSMGSSPFMFRAYLSAFILILAVRQIFQSRNVKSVVGYRWFACGFWLALSTIIYSESIVAILLVIVAMMMFRMNAPREYIAALFGLVMVFVIVFCIYVLVGVDFFVLWNSYIDFISIPILPTFTVLEWVFIGLTVLFFLLGIITMIKTSLSGRSDLVPGVLFFVVAFAVCGAFGVFTPLSSVSSMPITAIALSVILPSYFAGTKRNLGIKNFLFFVYILSAISMQYLIL